MLAASHLLLVHGDLTVLGSLRRFFAAFFAASQASSAGRGRSRRPRPPKPGRGLASAARGPAARAVFSSRTVLLAAVVGPSEASPWPPSCEERILPSASLKMQGERKPGPQGLESLPPAFRWPPPPHLGLSTCPLNTAAQVRTARGTLGKCRKGIGIQASTGLNTLPPSHLSEHPLALRAPTLCVAVLRLLQLRLKVPESLRRQKTGPATKTPQEAVAFKSSSLSEPSSTASWSAFSSA